MAGDACSRSWTETDAAADGKGQATYTTTPNDFGQQTYHAALCDLAKLCSDAITGFFEVGAEEESFSGEPDPELAASTTSFNRGATMSWFPYHWVHPSPSRPKQWHFLEGFRSRARNAVFEGLSQWQWVDHDKIPLKWAHSAEPVRRDLYTNNPGAECEFGRRYGGGQDGQHSSGHFTIYRNIVRWAEVDGASGKTLAYVSLCTSNVDDGRYNHLDEGALIGATMTFDRDEEWFFADGGEELGGRHDLRSVATHEWGHMQGWWGHFDENSSLCDPYTESPYVTYQTMCPYIDASTNYGADLNDRDKFWYRKAYEQGYWLVASDGGVFNFGYAGFHGSMGGHRLNQPMVGMSRTISGSGYWTVASDGGIFSFGDARFSGSTGSIRLNKPIVGMAPDPDGHGYWLVASDGGIFAFDAPFYGSAGGQWIDSPVVGMAAAPDGKGYWLVQSNGTVHNFGSAPYFGSVRNPPAPMTGMVSMTKQDAGGAWGFWLISRDGGVWRAGAAPNTETPMNEVPSTAFVGIGATRSGNGYHAFGWDQNNRRAITRRFGDAPYYGFLNFPLNQPIVGGVSRGFDE